MENKYKQNILRHRYLDECNKMIHGNIDLLLKQREISYDNLLKDLSQILGKELAENFLKIEIGCDDKIIIALSKYFNVNVNFFFEHHNIDIPVESKQDKQMKLMELMNILDLESPFEEDINLQLKKYTLKALEKECISISYAAYILNCSIQEVTKLKIE